MNNTEYANYLKGKSVALSIINSKQASKIESADIVVRLNKAVPVPSSLALDIGSRADIVYNCLYRDIDSGGAIDINLLKDYGVDWVCSPYPYGVVSNGYSFDEDINYFLDLNNETINFHHINKETYLELEKKLGSRPNTGVSAIIDLLSHQISYLYVTGFTFLETGYYEGYKNMSDAQVLKLNKESGNHKQAPQKLLIKHILKTDQRLKIDSVMAKLLKNSGG
jgi:hypothetical protein